MTRQEAIEILREWESQVNGSAFEALDMAIYALGTIEELRKERDAALDTAFAALKMREERKGKP